MSSVLVLCSHCAGSVRGVCSRTTPYCLRCCRQAATEDGFVCTGHPARKARVGNAAAPHSDPQADVVQDHQHESEEDSSDDSDYEPEPSHSDSNISESDTEEKSDTSEWSSPVRSRRSRSKRHKQQRPSSDSEDDDIPAHLKEPRPSLTTMQKALAKVKPWQKGVVQDGLTISCRAFLMQFESSLEMVNADTRDFMRMIPSWLVGEAALWYDNLRQQGSTCLLNWPAFKEALLLTYGDLPATHTAWEAVQTCAMRPSESIEAHCDRFRNKVIELRDRIPSWLCHEVYIKMMRPDTRRHLYSIFYDKIQQGERARDFSLDVICRAAIHYEKSIAPSTVTVTPVPTPTFTSSRPLDVPSQPIAQVTPISSQSPLGQNKQGGRRWKKDRQNKRPRDNTETDDQEEKKDGETPRKQRDLSHVICWNCDKPGHYKNACPEPVAQVKSENKSADRPKGRGGG
jgi:Zinc knuckle